ncbi:Target of rapamycin complex 1 subunit kog1 [Saxophila tyrrhenica]|uniref:Target of rapamycin complex 1 subunit kog1 n=1 Tax=Saxophila tyrrhenica TaxID=1690608 RepID=A0AAV9NZ91_9PEZI|nr:Target of rapamycin complex 1 subunit kog1 [Saxophila tyrrhenica]
MTRTSPGAMPDQAERARPSLSHESSNGHASNSDSDGDDGLQMGSSARLTRASSGLSSLPSHLNGPSEDGEGKEKKHRMRHGWDTQLDTLEQANLLSQSFYMYYEDKRHETGGNPPQNFQKQPEIGDWRMKDRLKTVSAVLALCLNVGVDPPDVIKTNPCARLECWVDPIPPDSTNQSSSNNANAQIGKNLQSQYENLSLRTRYKVILDPTIDELKRYTSQLRKNAHAERILFHYNGHGVPKPTASGEVWCFNRSYTQYIPISLFDLQDWVGAPGLWVWDCSAAGGIINGFMDGVQKHLQLQAEAMKRNPNPQPMRWEDCIHLAACKENEVLPTNPDLPADIFSSCLTTPIKMAIRFFMLQNPLSATSGITLAQASDIPGKVSERRTPLGELNWIFTAITDTIAWNCLEKSVFKKLFRQDLMVAALFRNFLLAQRIMRIYHCTPQCYPAIPDTHNHPLWQSWDLAVEMILAQLPSLIEQQVEFDKTQEGQPPSNNPPPTPDFAYNHSDFFSDQLSAFEVYLSSAPPSSASTIKQPKPPEQLPIVLQVLLSQVHRLRALILLSKFLDLGPWAVSLALSIGIFPYVLKLLQSQAFELKPPMVFIWARILAVDKTCQADLLKDNGFMYFANILAATSGIPVGNAAEHRAMCAFVVASFCRDFKPGKLSVMKEAPEVIESCLAHLNDLESPLLRQFSLLCLSNLWKDFPEAKMQGMKLNAHRRIGDRSHDPVPEVRAAALDALATLVGTGKIDQEVTLIEETVASVVSSMGMDGSIMVRKELTVFYSVFIKRYEPRFLVAAWEQLLEERDKKAGKDEDVENEVAILQMDGANDGPAGYDGMGGSTGRLVNGHRPAHQRQVSFTTSEAGTSEHSSVTRPSRTLSKKTIYRAVWRQVLSLSTDPHPEVARNAGVLVDYVLNALLESPLGAYANEVLDQVLSSASRKPDMTLPNMDGLSRQRSRDYRPQTPPTPSSTMSKADGYFGGLSRTASVATAMKNLVWWGGKTPNQDTPPSPTRSHRGSITADRSYRSRPLSQEDAAMMAPDALDNISGPAHQPPAKVPPSPYFRDRDMMQTPQLPLQSHIFDWSLSYFREPQMRPSEADEPGSISYNERLWRRNRNDKIIGGTQPLKESAGSQRWDTPCGYFGIGAAPAKMVFHQFENHLITADDRDSIAVWDWSTVQQLNRFSNSNPPGTRITELRFINEDDQAMIMTGSSDGIIRIFRNYADKQTIHLASSFRALSDLVVSDKQSAGLVFDWQQGQGRVLVAGDERVIRVWHAGSELCISDIPARSGSCITSLTSDQVEGHIFVAGFGNGSVRVYDQRCSPRDSMVKTWAGHHKSWIVGTHLQRGGLRELISAESNGGIRLWDIRASHPVASLPPKKGSTARSLRTLSVHEHAPVFATGGADHTIRVYTMGGGLKELSSAEPYMSYLRMTGFAGAGGFGSGPFGGAGRNAPITATAFHPHRMMLACGAVNDGHVNLFRCGRSGGGAKEGRGLVEVWAE